MATPRKRSSGFTANSESEETKVEELLEEVSTEMFETILHKEEEVPAPKPFVEESIIPTEDVGPRFIPEPSPIPVAKAPEPPKPVAPKRHPRNIPKFSRYKEL
jgi:hypothetical protein